MIRIMDDAITTAVRVLNEAFEADPVALLSLLEHETPCNAALAEHPTIQAGESIRRIHGYMGSRRDENLLRLAHESGAIDVEILRETGLFDSWLAVLETDGSHARPQDVVSGLGLINGLFGVDEHNWGHISVQVDDNVCITGFADRRTQ